MQFISTAKYPISGQSRDSVFNAYTLMPSCAIWFSMVTCHSSVRCRGNQAHLGYSEHFPRSDSIDLTDTSMGKIDKITTDCIELIKEKNRGRAVPFLRWCKNHNNGCLKRSPTTIFTQAPFKRLPQLQLYRIKSSLVCSEKIRLTQIFSVSKMRKNGRYAVLIRVRQLT